MYTKLLSVDNKAIMIPNGNLSNASITNVTYQEKRRVDLNVGIEYSEDIKKVRKVLLFFLCFPTISYHKSLSLQYLISPIYRYEKQTLLPSSFTAYLHLMLLSAFDSCIQSTAIFKQKRLIQQCYLIPLPGSSGSHLDRFM